MSMETRAQVGMPISSATSFINSTAFSPSVFTVVGTDVVVSTAHTNKPYYSLLYQRLPSLLCSIVHELNGITLVTFHIVKQEATTLDALLLLPF